MAEHAPPPPPFVGGATYRPLPLGVTMDTYLPSTIVDRVLSLTRMVCNREYAMAERFRLFVLVLSTQYIHLL